MQLKVDPGTPEEKRVYRKYLINSKMANYVDQLSILTGRSKQDIIEIAIEITACMYSGDQERIEKLLDEIDS